MAKKESTKKTTKKKTREVIFEKLAAAMSEFKTELNEKKVIASLKKISKTFADDMLKTAKKKESVAKKTAKKGKAKKIVPVTTEAATA